MGMRPTGWSGRIRLQVRGDVFDEHLSAGLQFACGGLDNFKFASHDHGTQGIVPRRAIAAKLSRYCTNKNCWVLSKAHTSPS